MNVQSTNVLLTLVRGPQPGAVGVEFGPAGIQFDLPEQAEATLAEAGFGPDGPDLWVLVTPVDAWDPHGPRDSLLSIEIALAAQTMVELHTLMNDSSAER